ncbi:DUF748 domain-containing protein [Shewanella olleyana]|uniref:DUF748 domain-containing protein n=1 Tax=Shewanella olleyana TaxID=135626 RepID=UPI00200D9EF2|nr:DUF748 domain-containing protein [Shewanella olleyana]MCL1068336.1 DUF748 domain-containing protein [Shewanella olleyana]
MMPLLNTLKLAFDHRPRYQKIAIIFSFFYLLFVLTLGLLLPFIATKQAPKSLSELLGRKVNIESIKVNPFTFEVSISQFTIDEQDNNKTFFHLDKLDVDIMFWRSLFSLNVSLDYLTIEGTTLTIERLGTLNSSAQSNSTPSKSTTSEQLGYQFNFTDIIETFDNRAEQAAKNQPVEVIETEEPSSPIAIHVNQFAFNNASLLISDKLTDTQLQYPNINLAAAQFKTDALLSEIPEANKLILSIADAQNGQVNLESQVQLSPIDAKGKLSVIEMDLTQYWSFVEALFKVSLQSANLNLTSTFNIEEPSAVILSTAPESVSPPLVIEISDTDIKLENIAANDDKRQVSKIDLFALNGINVSTQNQTIDIDELRTTDADFWITVAPEKINLVELFTPIFVVDESTAEDADTALATLNESDEQAPTAVDTLDETPTWLVTLNQFNLENYQFELTESVANKTANFWKISEINFSTQTIKSDLSLPIDYQLDLTVNEQSELTSQGQFDAKQLSLEADVSYQKVNLTKLQPYISPFMNVTLETGLFNTSGHISANAEQHFVYQGQASVNQLKIRDNLHKQPLLNWESMAITAFTFDNLAQSLAIDEILFDGLFSRLIIAEDRSTNIADLVVQSTSEDSSKPDEINLEVTKQTNTESNKTTSPNDNVAQESAFAIDIKRIGFKDSSAFFADNSLTPNFASGIEQLNGDITQISTNPETRASVDLEGKIDKYAPVTLKGDINPLLANPYLDLNLAFNKVELTSINPYSGTYAGYYIDKGQLSLALNYQLENNQLVGSNHLVIDQLELGKPSNSSLATSLPISLAIALLQDRHGVIDLGVDVDGDLDSPSFSFGSIVMTAITNVITKAITAPFSLLAGLVGGDEDEMDKISFQYGQSDITSEQQATLTSLAKALNDRPLLVLNIKGSVDLVNDQQALQQQQLHQKLATQAQMEFSALPKDLSASQYPQQGPLVDALINVYQTETQLDPQLIKQNIETENPGIETTELQTRWHIALYNFSMNQQEVEESQLGILAQNRAKTVKAYLVEQANIDPSRVFILESRVHMEQTNAQALLTLDAN